MFAFPTQAVKCRYFIKINQNINPVDFYALVKSQALALTFILDS